MDNFDEISKLEKIIEGYEENILKEQETVINREFEFKNIPNTVFYCKFTQKKQDLLVKQHKNILYIAECLNADHEEVLKNVAIVGLELKKEDIKIIFSNENKYMYKRLREELEIVFDYDLNINSMYINIYKNRIRELEGEVIEKGKF